MFCKCFILHVTTVLRSLDWVSAPGRKLNVLDLCGFAKADAVDASVNDCSRHKSRNQSFLTFSRTNSCRMETKFVFEQQQQQQP